MMLLTTVTGFCLLAAASVVQASVLRVGPGQAFAQPSQAALVARDGDTVEIAAGAYPGDVAVWRAGRLTLRGVGGRVVLDAQGKSAVGKGLWVIEGDDTVVEGIDFEGAADADHNGAGIRQEGRGLTVRRCVFHNNENGILANPSPESDILIEDCEFAHNGQGDGYSHNLYIGHVRRFTLRGCYVHDARAGHDVKSRAAVNEIIANRISDDGASDTSFLIDFPNGGRCAVIGNVLRRGPKASRGEMIAFAEEGASNPLQALTVASNTVVSDRARAALILAGGTPTLRVVNNLLLGPAALPAGTTGLMRGNCVASASDFRDSARQDYHLAAASAAIGKGYTLASVGDAGLTPRFEYVHPARLRPRPVRRPLDSGAYARDGD